MYKYATTVNGFESFQDHQILKYTFICLTHLLYIFIFITIYYWFPHTVVYCAHQESFICAVREFVECTLDEF